MVSIIVPIYNREKLLRRCVDSIVAQTYSNIEIILIDDGSTDASGQICDEYAAIDSRFRVLHQQNSGSSISRIRGIEMSRGDYIQFVDCDDWIEPNMVECMLSKAILESADIVWCDYVSHMPEPIIVNIPFDSNPSEMLNAIYQFKVSGCLWNRLYRADLLHDLVVTEVDNKEDVFYTTQILIKNPSMCFVAQPLYHYDVTPTDSLTKKMDGMVTCIPNYEKCYEFLVENNCLTSYKTSLSTRALRSKIYLLNQRKFKDAQHVLSFANFDIRNYPISFPLSIVYWVGLNCGVIGRLLFSLYAKLLQKLRLLTNRKNPLKYQVTNLK